MFTSTCPAPPGLPRWSGVRNSSSLSCSATQTLPWLPRVFWPLPPARQSISLNLRCHQCKVFHYFMNQEEKTLGVKLDTMFSYHLEFAFGSSWSIFSLVRCLSLLCTQKNGEHKQGRSFNLFLDVLYVFRYGSSGSSFNEELFLVGSASWFRGGALTDGAAFGSTVCPFFKKIIWKYSWFTMLCQFLMYTKWLIYIHSFYSISCDKP